MLYRETIFVFFKEPQGKFQYFVWTECTFDNIKTMLTGWKSFCDRRTVVLNLRKTALY